MRQIFRNLGEIHNQHRPTKILQKTERSGRRSLAELKGRRRKGKKANVSTSAVSANQDGAPLIAVPNRGREGVPK
jgi:hypothetical protein